MASALFVIQNWLQRSAGYLAGAEVPTRDLLEEAVRVRRAGVQIDALAWMALSNPERDALALADAAAALHADEETWADRARDEFVGAVKAARDGS